MSTCSQHGAYPYHACPVCRISMCEHRHLLQLPPIQLSYTGPALRFRQCAGCKVLGFIDQYGETRWMQEGKP